MMRLMSSRMKLFHKASLSPKCSEQEELIAESGSLLTISERVSWVLRVLGQINFL